MACRFLTDAERQIRPDRIAVEYPYTCAFELPRSKRGDLVFRRWFKTEEERERYIADLPAIATVIDRGEEIL